MSRGNNEIKISENNNLYVAHAIIMYTSAIGPRVGHYNSPVRVLTGEKIDLQINLLIRSNHIYADKTIKDQVLERDLLILYADLVINGI